MNKIQIASPEIIAPEEDIVIRLSGISKKYNLYNSRQDRLKEALHPRRKKYHREFYALKNINLEVKRGKVLGIVGKNGSGKSTLLKVISSILTPTAGNVEVKGKVVALLELGAGFNPQFTGMENIYFYCSLLGYDRKEIDALVPDILDFADLKEFIHQPIKTYSSGMTARLAFAVSVNVEPDILILDEVLAVGDEFFRRKCFTRMEEFFKNGKTVLFVSHQIQSINEICNEAILIDKGEIILKGPSKLVTTYYQNLLFTKNVEQFRKEIIEINKNEEMKQSLCRESVIDENAKKLTKEESDKEALNKSQNKANNLISISTFEDVKQAAAYIPNFKPTTIKMVKNYDVNISDIELRSLNGQKVNVLVMHENYILTYKFDFNICEKDVFFAYTIANEKGLIINNGNTRTNPLKEVFLGDRYLVEWQFSCLLMPGTYYVNIGTGSQTKGDIFNHIQDALAFKVISPSKLTTGGLVSLNQQPQISQLFN